MRALVTGAAGFIGSHLSDRLLSDGADVVAVDSFTDYYPRWMKEANIKGLLRHPRCQFMELDLVDADLDPLLNGTDYVFHLAAYAGVRAAWGANFEVYSRNNILATQRLLEAAIRHQRTIQKFVFASSSSIYGQAETLPTSETAPPQPLSPYGVTKLAGEHLCHLYWQNFGVPVVSLRFFSVYGPRHRPDLAFRIFIGALLEGQEIRIFGDGGQTRDFTYVDDAVEAALLAAKRGPQGMAFNIGGGNQISVNEAIAILEDIMGVKAQIRYYEPKNEDARHTSADTALAQKFLGFHPQVEIYRGLEKEVGWFKELIEIR